MHTGEVGSQFLEIRVSNPQSSPQEEKENMYYTCENTIVSFKHILANLDDDEDSKTIPLYISIIASNLELQSGILKDLDRQRQLRVLKFKSTKTFDEAREMLQDMFAFANIMKAPEASGD